MKTSVLWRLWLVLAVAAGSTWATLLAPDLASLVGYAWEVGRADAAAEQLVRGAVSEDLSGTYRRVAQAIKPSVVFINATQRTPRRMVIPEFREGRLGFREVPAPDEVRSGLGSGVIVSAEGHILTNNHVIAGFDKLEVTLTSGVKLSARVVGTDPATDVAVIQVDRPGLMPARLGDSDRVDVGEIVLAAGCPFGLDQTVTQGIISAKGRNNLGVTDYEDFLQTDAAVNPGNSGGPLVNLRGEVIGINTAIFSRSGGYQGISFAIPINLARTVMDRLIRDGRVRRGWLGVSIQDLTPELRSSFGLKDPTIAPEGVGVLVGDTDRDSPAERAGLRRGDILLAVNGQPIREVSALRNLIAGMEPKSTAALRVFRAGKVLELTATLGELSEETTARRFLPNGSNGHGPNRRMLTQAEGLGLSVGRLEGRTARVLGLEPNSAVLVTEVLANGPAAEAGLRPGDLILAVGDTSVGTPEDFERALADADLTRGVRLHILSGGRARFVFVRAG